MEPNAQDTNQQTPQTIEVIQNEDAVLTYTQKQRQKIVERLMKLEHDKLEGSDKTMLLMALDGMDRSALGRKRLKSDENISASQAAVAGLIAKVLATPGALQAGMMIDGITTRPVPQLPADIPEPDLVPGELDSGAPQMSYDTFMAQSPD
jgi:hypothetical protein